MKRTIPLLITAICGFAIAAALFIPEWQEWGERVAVWFDILAAIAFILGGGNLLKMQLKKISDRAAGWGYAMVTLIAFLVTLIVGLGKVRVPAAADQEYYGQVFASLALEDFPDGQVATVSGTIPERADGEELPRSVRRQISEDEQAGTVSFRGWMNPNQASDLLGYEDTLEWRCTVERLSKEAQPPEELQGKILYYADHEALAIKGYMDDETRDRLRRLGESDAWQEAVARLYERGRDTTPFPLPVLPENVDPETFPDHVTYDREAGELAVEGPMTPEQRDQLQRQFPLAKPLSDDERQELRREIERLGAALNEEQAEAFDKIVEGTWTADQLITVLDEAGKAQELSKSACLMLGEKRAGVDEIKPKIKAGADRTLNDEQQQAVRDFAEQEEMTVGELIDRLKEAGTFTGAQEAALRKFVNQNRTVGERKKAIWEGLLSRENPLSEQQRGFLLGDYRAQQDWEATVGQLFYSAHRGKFRWSGSYRAPGSPFAWIYEYAFKPLTATMFAMLAFFVASAAFRAFRAKNVEASLLLGTAFIILLGRTFAGVWLTDFIPATNPWLSWLRLEELTVFIMQVFNTAGNRAIMIGIALGIASTSLKVLLGIDRSYLGSREE